jgi:hypothetical protein
MKKSYPITDCRACPLFMKCDAFKKLSPKQRFMLKADRSTDQYILPDCHLNTIE